MLLCRAWHRLQPTPDMPNLFKQVDLGAVEPVSMEFGMPDTEYMRRVPAALIPPKSEGRKRGNSRPRPPRSTACADHTACAYRFSQSTNARAFSAVSASAKMRNTGSVPEKRSKAQLSCSK